MMTILSININKVALIRNSRPGNNPDLVEYALNCIAAGAQGITVHPRPDQRHIRAEDCLLLKNAINVEFNIEGNPFAGFMPSARDDVSDYPGFMHIVNTVKPAQCTLVPDSDAQLTSDHGFDLKGNNNALIDIISQLKAQGCRVSLFMDTDHEQLALAKEIGADRVEFYTGPYACFDNNKDKQQQSFQQYKRAADYALSRGLEVNAGHDLNLHNLPLFSQLPGLQEVSIGHAITVDALQYGLEDTVQRYLNCL